jgi:hypothetical protein
VAQRFAQVLAATWTDPQFLDLGTDARLLFLWALTNGRAACGLYPASVLDLERALGEGQGARGARVVHALAQLGRKPQLLYDDDNEVLWLVNRARHANASPRAARLMRSEWESCPRSPLRDLFHARYGQMLQLTEVHR